VKGEMISGGKSKIEMWSLDTDYDDRGIESLKVLPLS
jgi:adenine-specific DNA-methyltransferase